MYCHTRQALGLGSGIKQGGTLAGDTEPDPQMETKHGKRRRKEGEAEGKKKKGGTRGKRKASLEDFSLRYSGGPMDVLVD